MQPRELFFQELHGLHPQFRVLTLVWSEKGVVRLLFTGKSTLRREFRHDLVQEVKKPNTPAATEAVRFLKHYFSGQRGAVDLPALDEEGTVFQRAVWSSIREIHFGRTSAYGQIAKAVGRELGSRAVGQATGANPLPIFTPCHRVVGSKGKLGGFSGGLARKRALLALEGILCR